MWALRHRPSLAELPESSVKALSQAIDRKRPVIIVGRTGTGKTTLVYALADERDWEVVELSASDVRGAKAIEAILGPASTQMSLFSKSKLILIDDIDALSDRGGLPQIERLLQSSAFPVVMTAQSLTDKLSKIKRKSAIITMPDLGFSGVKAVLLRVRDEEGASVPDEVVAEIAAQCGPDLRAAITDLEVVAALSKQRPVAKADVIGLGQRGQAESISQALLKVLKTTNLDVALRAFDSIDEDPDTIFLWVEENMQHEYTGADLARGMDVLSKADILRGRIRRRQYWRLLAYIMPMLSGGVAAAKDAKRPGMSDYKRSDRILQMWIAKNRWKKAIDIAAKLGAATHC
ncbi:hypothetical protein COY28_03570, partial [Candidatus Woesearchaeota archaeon CG_4_10_14_0_2_um_filter_57_5]